LNHLQKIPRSKGFRDVRVTARLKGQPVIAAQGKRGDSDDWDLSEQGILPDHASNIEAGKFGQLNIHQNEIWALPSQRIERLLSIVGLHDRIAGCREEVSDDLSIICVIFNMQDQLSIHSLPPTGF